MSWLRLGFALLPFLSLSLAAAPSLTSVKPPGAQAGISNLVVTANGKFSTWPAEMWASHAGIRFKPDAKKKGTFAVAVSNDVPAGAYLIRAHDKTGASGAAIFVVGTYSELMEKEDNGMIVRAQTITNHPVVVNGALSKSGDTDFFRIPLKRGQRLTASLQAYGLRSLIDPFIHMYDPRGYEVAVASDSKNLDPIMRFTARETGTYALQLFAVGHKASTSVTFSGRSDAVYRLTLEIDGEGVMAPNAKVMESRGTNTAQVLKTPVTLAGRLSKPGEIDRFQFSAKKGEQFLVRVESHQLGYPVDPVMVINRPGGRLLRETDDVKPYRDPEYLVKASDGDYTVEIRDRFLRGGDDFYYRLVISPPKPHVEATVDNDILSFEAGKDTEIKLKLNRKNGHTAKLRAVIDDLPKGVTLVKDEIDEKAKTATLKCSTATNAPAASGAFRILLEEENSAGNKQFKVSRSFVTGDSRGDYLLNGTDWLWMTVKPVTKKEAKKEETKK